MRLGLATLSDIFLSTAMSMRVFRAVGYEKQMATLRRHSTATAHICRVVSRHTSFFDEYAFLCGLLHDVGIAALIIALTDKKHKEELPHLSVVWPAILLAHTEASAALCRMWGLAPDVVLAVGSHHATITANTSSRVHPLAAVVAVADHLATKYGAGVEGETDELGGVSGPQQVLGIPDKAMQRIEIEAQAIIAKLD